MCWLSNAYCRLAKRIWSLLGSTGSCQMTKCSTPETCPQHSWSILIRCGWCLTNIPPGAGTRLLSRVRINAWPPVGRKGLPLFCRHFLLYLPLGFFLHLFDEFLIVGIGCQGIVFVVLYCGPAVFRAVG